jgi:hypothetical protein
MGRRLAPERRISRGTRLPLTSGYLADAKRVVKRCENSSRIEMLWQQIRY